jgi:hypothetical protein
MREVPLPDLHERRYTYGGRVAHVINAGNGFSDSRSAVCGYDPVWTWLGSGSQREEDEAAAMRLCRNCVEVLARAVYLRTLYPDRWFAPLDTPHKAHEGRCRHCGKPWPCTHALREMRSPRKASAP